MISKYPKGASLDASANFKESINNKWPIDAKKPIANIIYHSWRLGWTQIDGTINDPMIAPTIPVNKSVNNGWSDLCNFLVTIR